MIRINEILESVAGYMDTNGLALVQKAYVYSAAAHAGQIRRSGEPYLVHPLEVAGILAEMRMDEATIAAGLLHDVVEDTKASVEDIDETFGEGVADIVNGLTKLSRIEYGSREAAQAESIRKMFLATAEDIRVLFVKLADRLHNMRTLEHMPSEKQVRISRETLDIYAPLANRLGLHRVKVELEDLSLKYLKPDVYNMLAEGVASRQTVNREYVDRVVDELTRLLKKQKIKGRVHGRTKHLYSIHHKMEVQGLTFEEVHDIIAFRCIVESLRDCYAVLGLAHEAYKPVPGRFKDYISLPKANGYQSLHTTVIGPEGERIEIQIRTEEMHRLAEHGVAAHWLYKEKDEMQPKDIRSFSWLRDMLDWQKEASDSREFLSNLHFDLFSDEVYVFTPRGLVKELPEGATPVDFAYTIHTEVGDHCNGARINGKIVPLSYQLKNGDTVEILTAPQRHPSRDWLKFVKTAKARTRINHYIRTEERARTIALGREILEKEGRRMGVNLSKVLKAHQLDPVAEEFSFKNVDDLISAVGYGRLTPRKVLHRLLPREEGQEDAAQELERAARDTQGEHEREGQREAKPGEGIVLSGVGDVLVRYANCCHPLPGDPVVGYQSPSRGLIIHTADCPNLIPLKENEPDRIISVSWEGDAANAYDAKIDLLCHNRPGTLAEVAGVLSGAGVNITSGNFHSDDYGATSIHFKVSVRDKEHLYSVIELLRGLPGVKEVSRHAAKIG